MCIGGRPKKPDPPAPIIVPPAPPPAPPPPPPPVAPPPPPPPRQVSYVGKTEGGFRAGRKKKKDRSQSSKGTGSLRIARTGVKVAGAGGQNSSSGVQV